MNNIQIYGLIDPITRELRYVGKSKNVKRRFYQHLYDKRVNTYCCRWISKLQRQNLKPVLIIIDDCNKNNWKKVEKYWIKYFSKNHRLTNLTSGGDGICSYKHTEETKRKISKALTGRKLSKKQIESMKKRLIGKKASKSTKKKISNSLKAFYKTKKGKILGKKLNDNLISYTKKPVLQFDLLGNFIKKYESMSEASRKTGCSISKISLVCSGKRTHTKKFKFVYE